MRGVRLKLTYDGTDFAGWQLQPTERTVQGVLERAIGELLRSPERVVVRGCSRTDAGVHARAQIATFDDPRDLPLSAWTLGLRSYLPDDLVVLSAEHGAVGADPRQQVRGKRYVYRLWNGPHWDPLRRRQFWLHPDPLDLGVMRKAATDLLGKHDFSSFRSARCNAKSPIKTLNELAIAGSAGAEIQVTVVGDAFLRYMVRILVGTLVEVGTGCRAADSLSQLLEARDRCLAGLTAPPQGLCLEEVYTA